MDYERKRIALKAYLLELARTDLVVAFSGGVDSAVLLHLCCAAARENGTKVTAIMMQTSLQPYGDADIARKVAIEAGADYEVLQLGGIDEAGIRMNPIDRCYHCKHFLFSKLLEKAALLEAAHVIEGTNGDDLHVYRPGIKALHELGILSPLAQFGITKEEVRRMATEMGLSVAKKPSTPCMATRFPYGTQLDEEIMNRVNEAETWLREQGFYNVRLRVHRDIARIEVGEKDMESLLQIRKKAVEKFKALGFSYITLDMEGYRSGSMDIHIKEGK